MDSVQTTLNTLNGFNKNIQFTVEEKTDHSFPFFDTKVTRTKGNKLMIKTVRFINYYSNHQQNQKYNTIMAMKNRVTHIGDESFLNANLSHIQKINCYIISIFIMVRSRH